jgi:phosphoenolpyruvate carboxylase
MALSGRKPNQAPDAASDRDQPLRDDIRLLGRLLGDTIRDHEGAAIFELVERMRTMSVRFHRDNDQIARRELDVILKELSLEQVPRLVRAATYFSHLANIAEDQHHIRRTRAHTLAGSAPRVGTIAHALARAANAGIRPADLHRFFDSALVSPVLTAHPTEVRRKAVMTLEMAIAALLDQRDRTRLTPEEETEVEEKLRRAVVTLWQTNLLRGSRLTVLDEVTNGLSYYDYTFLREVPRLYCAPRKSTAGIGSGRTGSRVRLFSQTGKLDRRRSGRQSLRHR